MALKTEAIGLAITTELPLVICDIQRGGPSTGLPTKTEQADLLQALFGRNSEAPVPVLAAVHARRLLLDRARGEPHRDQVHGPVIVLSDGYLANGAEPWKIPTVDELPEIPVQFRTDPEGFLPYLRDPQTLARPWAVPGTPGLEHRIGGLEKQDVTGNVNYEPLNHEQMVRLRAAKVEAHRAGRPGRRARGRSRRRPAARRLGLDLRRDHRGAARAARARAAASATSTCAT